MNSTHIILGLAIFCVVLFIMLLAQRKINATRYEALLEELFDEQTLRLAERGINNVIIARKEQEISKLKTRLAASEKLRKELSEKHWEEEALR